MTNETRMCPWCKRTLPVTDFPLKPGHKRARYKHCRQCRQLGHSCTIAEKTPRHVMTPEERKEHKREYFRRYREENRERINRQTMESYYRKHPTDTKPRVCAKCGRELPEEAFRAADGRRRYSKFCLECRGKIVKPKAKPKPKPKPKPKKAEKPKPFNPLLAAEEKKRKRREYMREWQRRRRKEEVKKPTISPEEKERRRLEKLELKRQEQERKQRERERRAQEREMLKKARQERMKAEKEKRDAQRPRLCDTCEKCPCIVGFENFSSLGYDKCRDYKPRQTNDEHHRTA